MHRLENWKSFIPESLETKLLDPDYLDSASRCLLKTFNLELNSWRVETYRLWGGDMVLELIAMAVAC
jgi:hypothetical protein